MSKKSSQWLIRSSKGKIDGPLSTREVMLHIKNGQLDGTESISRYPGGKWRPISHNSEFYDFLLTSLSKVGETDDDETNWNYDPVSIEADLDLNISGVEPIKKKELPKKKPTSQQDDQRKRFLHIQNEKSSAKKEKKLVDKSKEYDFSSSKKDKILQKEKTKQEKQKRKKEKKDQLAKAKQLAQAKKEKGRSNFAKKLLILVIGGLGLFLFLDSDNKVSQSDVAFLFPNKQINMPPENVKKLADEGVKYFLSDTFNGYIKAQINFVKVLEADATYEDIYSLLCVSQYNLWDYSNKDIKLLKSLVKVVEMSKKYDSTRINYENCNNIYLILSGNNLKAEKNIDNLLAQLGDSNLPPTISYFLKSEILVSRQKFNESIEFVSMLEELWPDWSATHYLSAVTYFNLNQKEQAINGFKKILKKNPKNKKALIYVGAMRNVFFDQYEKSIAEIKKALNMRERVNNSALGVAHYYLADSYLRLNDQASALPHIKDAYKNYPLNKKIENLYVNYFGGEEGAKLSDVSYIAQGDQFFYQEDYNAAQAYYKEAIKVNPKNTDAATKAAKSLWKLRLSDDSIELLKKSLVINPKSVEVAILLSDYLSDQYKFNAAFEVLNKTHKSVRGHYKIYTSFAALELKQKNYLKSIKYADKAITKYGEYTLAYVVKGQSLFEIKKYKEAYTLMLKVLDMEPTNIEAQKIYSLAYYKVHGIESGVRHLNKLIQRQPTIKEFRYILAEVYYMDEQFSPAVNVYKQLIDIDKNYTKAYMGLAKSYKKMGSLNESKKAYFQAVQVDPFNSQPLLQVGLLYLETKNYRKAEKQFRRIFDVNPNFPKIHYYFAKLYFLRANYSEAIKWINKEKARNPNLIDAYLLAGEIYEKQGSYQFCAKEYQQAMKFREFGAAIYIKISRCYRKSGALDVAVNMLEKARKIDSTVPDVYRELGAVYELKSENAKARWAYENYISLAPNALDIDQVQLKIQSL